MSFLQSFGIRSRKVRPVGTTLETGDANVAADRRKNVVIKTGIFGTLLVVTMAVFPFDKVYTRTIVEDEVWREDNLSAPFDFPIVKSDEEREEDRRQIRLTEPAIFVRDPEFRARIRERRASLSGELGVVFDQYASFQENLTRGRMEEAFTDSIAYLQARSTVGMNLSATQWNLLVNSYTATVPGLSAPSRTVSPQRLDEVLLAEAYNRAIQILQMEVVDIPIDSVFSDLITIRDESIPSTQDISINSVRGIDSALEMGRNGFQNQHPSDADVANIALAFFNRIFQPSLNYDRVATETHWGNAEKARSPTQNFVRQNEVIVRRGERITEEIQQKLISLESELLVRSGVSLSWSRYLGLFILVVSTYLIFFLYLYLLRKPIFDNNRMVFVIAVLFLTVIGIYGVAMRAAFVDMYVVPVATIAIMLTIIFDSRVALFGTLTLAMIGGHLLSFDMEFMFATLFASTLGIFSVRDIRNRSQFFLSAGLVFLGYILVISAAYLLQNTLIERTTDLLVFSGINSVLLLLAYPLLWIFERVFDITTDLTLLELSDTNRPLLKQLSMEAPGTFNHVLQVANLSEAASTAIGANALLTRVGALYHDIGKMSKPEYFVENQRSLQSPHDQLKPRMSALIIANHVKEGLELAKQYSLPKQVQDFIPMHHGTTRIQYFYHKAQEQQKIDGSTVMESEFRYPGPKPNTAETSILMLADSIEAAARTIDNPNHKRLESLIHSIVQDRMKDGQLDECGLTFADLNRVKETFLTVLMGFYHIRVKYPGSESNEDESVPDPVLLPEAVQTTRDEVEKPDDVANGSESTGD